MEFSPQEVTAGLLMGGVFLLVFALASVVRVLFPERAEWARKTSHLLGGLVALGFPLFIQDERIVGVMCVLFLALLIVSKRSGRLVAVHGVERPSWGAYLFPVAIFLIFVLAKKNYPLYFISILVLSVSDTAAALIGGRYGSVKIPVEGNLKSVEGSVAFAIVTFLCVQIPLLLMTSLTKPEAILLALIVALVVTGFELVALDGTDNLFIPLGVFYIANRLPGYPLDVYFNTLFELGLAVALVLVLTGWNRSLRIGWKVTMVLFMFASLALCGVWWAASAAAFLVVLSGVFAFPLRREGQESLEVKAALHVSVLPVIPIFISAGLGDPHRGYGVFVTALCSVGILAAQDSLGSGLSAAQHRSLPGRAMFWTSVAAFPLAVLGLPLVLYPGAFSAGPFVTCVLAGMLVSIGVFVLMRSAPAPLGRRLERLFHRRDWAVGAGCVATFLIGRALSVS